MFIAVVSISITYFFNIHGRYDYFCNNNLSCALNIKSLFFGYYQVIFLPLLSVITVLLVLLFTKETIYKSWRNFSLVFLPMTAFFIASAEKICGAIVCLLTREAVTLYMSILFLIISFSIIAIKSWKLRGKPNKKGSLPYKT